MATSIELKNIHIYATNYPVLNNISLNLPPNKFSVIIGPSGCGKSTLLKVIAGIIIPDSGHIFYDQKDFYQLTEKEVIEFRKKNGFVFQDSALWANKTIFENLALPLTFHFPEFKKDDIYEKIVKALKENNLEDSLYLRPAQLSVGEQKLVSFIRALINDPSLIFIDEPTSLIDRPMRRKIISLLAEEKQKAKTIITATHDNGIISQLADFIVVLDNGKLLQAGPKNEVFMSTYPRVNEIIKEITTSSIKEFQT